MIWELVLIVVFIASIPILLLVTFLTLAKFLEQGDLVTSHHMEMMDE